VSAPSALTEVAISLRDVSKRFRLYRGRQVSAVKNLFHPEFARFVLEAAGYRDIEIRYVNQVPPDGKLQRLEPLWYMRRYEEVLMSQINDNFERLNQLLWGAQDYAVIGRHP
jgi:hypothetical protein